jgi:hypothetical protein
MEDGMLLHCYYFSGVKRWEHEAVIGFDWSMTRGR